MAKKKISRHFEGKFRAFQLFLIVAALIVICCLHVISKNRPLPEGTLELFFLDVAQGDATLIATEEGCVLIDAGESSEVQTVYMTAGAYGNRLEYLIITHAHSDHMGGATYILEHMEVNTVILPQTADWDSDYIHLMETIGKSGAAVQYATPDMQFSLGDARFTFLAPLEEYGDINNTSAVIRMDYGDVSVLFTGDAEAESEIDQLRRYGSLPIGQLNVDILHVGHHGSSSSSTEAYLAAVSPQIAVISCGKNNFYGHPTATVLARLRELDTEILRTDLLGTIHMTIEGNTVSVKTQNRAA